MKTEEWNLFPVAYGNTMLVLEYNNRIRRLKANEGFFRYYVVGMETVLWKVRLIYFLRKAL